ncbi:MAG: endo-1,4-beta-xylanase [bacterium]
MNYKGLKFIILCCAATMLMGLSDSDDNNTTKQKPSQATLKTLSDDLNIVWGTSLRPDGMSDALYKEVMAQQFNLVVADYGMYIVNIQYEQDEWDFSDMDEIVKYGESHNMKIRGHALVWGFDLDRYKEGDWLPTPEWVHNSDLSREDMINIMYEHIDKVMNRYGNRINEWIVVNEAISNRRNKEMARNVWFEKIGEDYVELAFKHADKIAPNAVLILNDFGADYVGQSSHKVDKLYNYTKKLLQKGIPIDGIGLQFHLTVGIDNPTVDDIVNNFIRYRDLGLDVYITELDVKIKEPVTGEKLKEQARLYSIVMKAVLESDACNSITVWGYTDRYTWIHEWQPGYDAPCMYDENIKPKPAYNSVIETMKR